MLGPMPRRKFLYSAVKLSLAAGLVACDTTEDPDSSGNTDGNSSAGASDGSTDSTDAGNVPSLGNRTFGIVALEPESRDFGPDVIQPILSSGATSTTLSVYWDDIEGSAGSYNPAINFLDVAETIYPPFGLAVNLGFSVIDTNNKRLAPHLNNRAFDDPDVISDFNSMLDWARTQIPTLDVKSIHIGNEVDVYLDQNPSEWPAWITFFTATAAHARTLWPNIPVGCKTTFGGIMGANRTATIDLHNQADATFITYYHMDSNFLVLPPAAISNTFSDMANYPVDKPVQILEIGVPSDARNGGSEQHQADFVTEMFRAWDEQSERISHLEFFALTDFSPAVVQELLGYYNLNLEAFEAFLGSLGLRTWPGNGTDKAAWGQLVEELAIRS